MSIRVRGVRESSQAEGSRATEAIRARPTGSQAGNLAIQRRVQLAHRLLVAGAQAKGAASAAPDPHEMEADQVAKTVVGLGACSCGRPGCDGSCGGAASAISAGATGLPQRKEATPSDVGSIPGAVRSDLGAGSPMDPSTRGFFESRFRRDFSHTLIHADSRAARAAASLNAQAFTVGRHVVFGENRYQPETPSGRHLLAHELTHVVQQRATGPRIQRQGNAHAAPPLPSHPDPGGGGYNPCNVNVDGLTNGEYVEELVRVRQYMRVRSRGEGRYFDYAHLWRRLEGDRRRRALLGHAWLGLADIEEVPRVLLELIPGSGRTIDVAHAVREGEIGAPFDHHGSVVMSNRQFESFLEDKGAERMDIEELLARAESEGREGTSFEMPLPPQPAAPLYQFLGPQPGDADPFGQRTPFGQLGSFGRTAPSGQFDPLMPYGVPSNVVALPGPLWDPSFAAESGRGLPLVDFGEGANAPPHDDLGQRMAAAATIGSDLYRVQPIDATLAPHLARQIYSDGVDFNNPNSVRGAELYWRGHIPEAIAQHHLGATQLNDLMPNFRVYDLLVTQDGRVASVTHSVPAGGQPNLDWYDTKLRRATGDLQFGKFTRAVADLQQVGHSVTRDAATERAVVPIPDDHVDATRSHVTERVRNNPSAYTRALDAQLRRNPIQLGSETVTSWQQLEGLRQVDINNATAAELRRLPGIGAQRAQHIIIERSNNGPFTGVDDLSRVHGIGEVTIEGVRSRAGSNPTLSDQRFGQIVDDLALRVVNDGFTGMGRPAQMPLDLQQFRRDTASISTEHMARFQRGAPGVFEQVRLGSDMGSTRAARGAMSHRAGVGGMRLGAGMAAGVTLFQMLYDPDSHSLVELPVNMAMGGAEGYAGAYLEEQIALRAGRGLVNTASRMPALAGPLSAMAPGARILGGAAAGGVVAPAFTMLSMVGTELFTDSDFIYIDYAAKGARTATSGMIAGGAGTAGGFLGAVGIGALAGSEVPLAGTIIGGIVAGIAYHVADETIGEDVELAVREGLGEYGCTGRVPYGEGVDNFMGSLHQGAFGHWRNVTRADGEITREWVPADPRYALYRGPLERHYSGESGGCQTCHDVNWAYGRTGEIYGDPTPDRTTDPFGGRLPDLLRTFGEPTDPGALSADEMQRLANFIQGPEPSG